MCSRPMRGDDGIGLSLGVHDVRRSRLLNGSRPLWGDDGIGLSLGVHNLHRSRLLNGIGLSLGWHYTAHPV